MGRNQKLAFLLLLGLGLVLAAGDCPTGCNECYELLKSDYKGCSTCLSGYNLVSNICQKKLKPSQTIEQICLGVAVGSGILVIFLILQIGSNFMTNKNRGMHEVFHRDKEDNHNQVSKNEILKIMKDNKDLELEEIQNIAVDEEEDNENDDVKVEAIGEEEKKIAEHFSVFGKLPPIEKVKMNGLDGDANEV